MSDQFEHGYAVVLGVDQNNVTAWALPDVAKDVQALHDVLVHPERCAYAPENVHLLQGKAATAKGISDALIWLQEKVEADEKATAVIYYSGHGFVDPKADQYYLIPYDVRGSKYIRSDAMKAETFSALISDINAKRLLVVLDCCHAAGMGAKEAGMDTAVSAPFPIDNLPETKEIPTYKAKPGIKAVSDLLEGEGRAILNSSTGAQRSYMRTDRKMSLFTYHFIEALTGHAPLPEDAKVVLVTDVMSWVTHEVKKSARQINVEQTPVMRTSGVFPIAQLIGGKGVAEGEEKMPPDPFSLESAPVQNTTINQPEKRVGGHDVAIVAQDVKIDHIGNK